MPVLQDPLREDRKIADWTAFLGKLDSVLRNVEPVKHNDNMTTCEHYIPVV